MEKPIQRSLSKKLDGGYLHVKRHKLKSSQKKKKSGGYSNYLKRLQGGAGTKDKQNQSSNEGSKVVSIRVKKLSPKKKSSKKKPKKEVKDIPILPTKSAKSAKPAKPEVTKPEVIKPEVTKPEVIKPEVIKPEVIKPEVTKPTEPAKPEVTKPEVTKPTEPAKPEVTKPVQEKPIVTKSSRKKQNGIPVSLPVVNKKLKPHKVLKRSKNKSLTKRRKKGKRISVSKVRIMNNREIDTIQDKLKQIRNKSTDEIKQELNKQGLQMSGKSPEILKDIYLYSQLCGITIQRE